MRQNAWFVERLRFWLWILGAILSFGLVGLLLSAMNAPLTLTWAAAAGAAVAGGWAASQFIQRASER